jgi:hypothetical protein
MHRQWSIWSLVSEPDSLYRTRFVTMTLPQSPRAPVSRKRSPTY